MHLDASDGGQPLPNLVSLAPVDPVPAGPDLHELGWHRTGPNRAQFEKYQFIMEPTWYEAQAIKDGGLKVLITTESNPALAEMGQVEWQNAVKAKDENGRHQLELLVSFEIMMSETAKYADLVLPDKSFFERWELLYMPWWYNFGVGVALRQPVVEAPGECRHANEIFIELGKRLVPEYFQFEDDIAYYDTQLAGLSCAYFLARKGYPVTVFEKASVLGGMLTTGIPSYRLPKDLVEAEIQVIRDMGVEMKTDIEFGKDVTVETLRNDGYKAFFIGIGTQECKEMDAEGEDLEGIFPGIDFLNRINREEKLDLGKRVAVIGGGNTAFDAVRTARRLGAEEACLIYRRTVDEMLANTDEIHEAQAEGIPIHLLTQPVRFIGTDGRVTAVECIKMELGEPDKSGRRAPEPVSGSTFTIEVDAVINALGQESDWACLTPECACQLTDWGTLQVDPVTFQSDDADIFAGGDAVTGPRTVIEAIAGGKEAAVSINRFIQGVSLHEGRGGDMALASEFPKEKYHPAPRAEMPVLKAEDRVTNFEEVQSGLTEEMAVEEAKRCLACGSACIQSCPYDVIQFDLKAGISHKCNLCIDRTHVKKRPVCVDVCMTDAITFGEYGLIKQWALDEGRSIMEELSKESVLYVK